MQALNTTKIDTFKKAENGRPAGSIVAEFDGLACLRQAVHANPFLEVPECELSDEGVLLLENITQDPISREHLVNFGLGMAQLHAHKHGRYGYGRDNFIGLSPQINTFTTNWGEFFAQYRLNAQIDAIEDEQMRDEFQTRLDDKRSELVAFLNANTAFASLLHGDLWSGNVLFKDKKAWLIDPAVYFGDREADIAMTELFGGFGRPFYDAYNEVLPLSDAYALKKVFYNLYHYLNHFNLFGESYRQRCYDSLSALDEL